MRTPLLAATAIGLSAALLTPTAPTAHAAGRRDATPPWTAGTPISRADTPRRGLGFWCTSGLPARKGTRTYLLTAGHCAPMGTTIYTAWTNGHRRVIGTVTGTSSRLDVAAIRTRGPVSGRVWAGSRTVPITGVATVRPGQSVCHAGARSGRVCGITVVSSTRDKRGRVTVYGRVTVGQTAARGGDSGGLVTDARGRAVGIVSAISRDGRWVSWTPARDALRVWGMTPVTAR